MGIPYAEVIGHPIAHSKSPLIHIFWLSKLGIVGDYRRQQVSPDNLPAYLASRKTDEDWRGCSVTMPLKQVIVPFLAGIDAAVEKLRAANTVVPDEDRGCNGFNTDVQAVKEKLNSIGDLDYPTHVATYVQIIGAGGAARAAMLGAIAAGYGDFDFFNRSLRKAREMARLMGLNSDAYASSLIGLGPVRNPGEGAEDQRYSHIVINATSMGMLGNPDVPIDLSLYHIDTVVLDMAYGEEETGIVRQARGLGMRVFDGFDMLIAQAAAAFRLFFGEEAPRECDTELRELLLR